MIGFFLDTSSVGFYNIALPTALILMIPTTALRHLVNPIMIAKIAKKQSIRQIYKKVMVWTISINLPLTAFLIIFAKPIIHLLFGPEYIGASPTLIVLTIFILINSLMFMNSIILFILKKTKILLFTLTVALGLMILGNIYFIPKIGILGAAIGEGIGIIALNTLNLFFLIKFLRKGRQKI